MAYTGPVTLQSAATATGNGTSLNVQNRRSAGLQVTGTFTATVTFEATIDGSNWVALNATPSNSATPASTATAAGIWVANVAGFVSIRARVSAYTSGSITVTAFTQDL
jgi:hypothetical protein